MAKRMTPLPPAPPQIQTLDEADDLQQDGEDMGPILNRPDEDGVKLQEFMNLFGGKEYKVRVEQYDTTDKCWAHIDTFHVDGFEPYEVCKRFGPGRYRMTFLNEQGKYVRGGQPQIRIGGKAVLSGQPPATAADANPLTNPIVMMMLANAEAQRKESAELLKAIIARPEPAKSSTNEVMDLLIKLQAMNPKEKADDTMKKLSETLLLRMVEKGLDGDSGGGDSGGGILSDIKEAMPIIKEMLASRGPLPLAPRQSTRAALPQPSPAQPPENPEMKLLFDGLRPYVAILVNKAAANTDQDRAAAFVLDELYDGVIPLIKKNIPLAALASEESIIESIVGRAKDPAQLEALFVHVPELAPYREWVLSVLAKTIILIETPAEEQPS